MEEIIIANITTQSFFRYTKTTETDIEYNKILVPFDSNNRAILSIMFIPNYNLLKIIIDNWDENTNKLSFNQKYFESVNEEQPILHENIHLVSNDFTISFSRVENLFYIRDVIKSQDVLIRIYNGQNGNLLSSSDLNLYENIDLFYGFEHEKFSDIPNFTKFRIEVLNENHLIHHEFLYI